MFYADSEKGRVSAQACASNKIRFDKPFHGKDRVKLLCPLCKSEVHLVEKASMQPYFRHCSLMECEYTRDGGMTDWHQAWQSAYEESEREAIINFTLGQTEYKKHARMWSFPISIPEGKPKPIPIRHRADVKLNNVVIEFQNSKMTAEEFAERTWAYNYLGYYVIWVFNLKGEDANVVDAEKVQSAYARLTESRLSSMGDSENSNLAISEENTPYRLVWKWNRPRKTFDIINPSVQRLRTNFELWFCTSADIKGSPKKGYHIEDACLYKVDACVSRTMQEGEMGFRIPYKQAPLTLLGDFSEFITCTPLNLVNFVKHTRRLSACIDDDYKNTMNFID